MGAATACRKGLVERWNRVAREGAVPADFDTWAASQVRICSACLFVGCFDGSALSESHLSAEDLGWHFQRHLQRQRQRKPTEGETLASSKLIFASLRESLQVLGHGWRDVCAAASSLLVCRPFHTRTRVQLTFAGHLRASCANTISPPGQQTTRLL